MKRVTSLSICVLTLCGLSALFLSTPEVHASGKAAKNYLDWKIMGAGTVKAGGTYTLVNVTENESIRYGKRKYGINIVWDKSTTLNNIRLDKKGTGPLVYGDVVAIHVDKGGYVQYQRRAVGFNIVWSTPAVYEWTIMGGKKGAPVTLGAPVGFFNEAAKDFLIYGERPTGVNLRWWKDRELSGGLLDRVKSVAQDLDKQGFSKTAEDFAKDQLKK